MEEAPRFNEGDTVVRATNRSEVGQVIAQPRRDAGEYWVRVRMFATGSVKDFAEDQLEPYEATATSVEDLAKRGHFGPLESFRRALAVERIRQRDRSTVYSYNAQRILFEAYQYKPLLKLLDSVDRRLLIADEVGLGKTVEAGLVLSELEARQSVERVLVVCPSRLRQKWREEMNRKFGQDFVIYERNSLLEYLHRARENPARTPLRGIVSMQSLRNRGLIDEFKAVVAQLDVAIVDEAHHARNPGTLTATMLTDLCDIADCVLLLTATPLHLRNRDLYTLASALRPKDYTSESAFDADLRHHEPLHRALALVRTRDAERLPQVIEALRDVFASGKSGSIEDPLAADVIAALERSAPTTRREWIDVERKIDRLHPLSAVMTRTRKSDVQEHRAVRRPKVHRVPWTDAEQLAYTQLVDGVNGHGWVRQAMGFGQIQRARQAASCLPAMLEKYAEIHAPDLADELSDIASDEDVSAPGSAATARTKRVVLPRDSKFEKLVSILQEIERQEPGTKVLVFTYFVGTSVYLARELTERGIPALRIAGDVPSTPNQPATDERGKVIQRFRDDPEMRVLVSTEVGSEGLDFQFCHQLVNYDLPWNPMVVEQRIGRIDRFGQQADVLVIHTLVVEGTVEDRILFRLYDRIKIFERSIGALESILGETISDLQADYIAGRLLPEEADARVEQAANAIEKRKLELEQLEAQASDLFGHEDFIRDEMERVRKLGRFLSPRALLSVVRGFLDVKHSGLRLKDEGGDVFSLRVNDALRADLRHAADGDVVFDHVDGRMTFTTDGQAAYRTPGIELLNVSSPLIRAAVETLSDSLRQPETRVGAGMVRVDPQIDPEIPDGEIAIVVHTQEVEGVRKRRFLELVAWSCQSRKLLTSEASERLLHLLSEQGSEWSKSQPPPALADDALAAMTTEARRRNRELKEIERRENDALIARKKKLILDEARRRLVQVRAKLDKVEARGHDESIQRMFRAQIEKAEERRDRKLDELARQEQVSVVLDAPIAIAIADVRYARTESTSGDAA